MAEKKVVFNRYLCGGVLVTYYSTVSGYYYRKFTKGGVSFPALRITKGVFLDAMDEQFL